MVSNIAARNIYLILAISSFCGLIYSTIEVILGDGRWITLCPIAMSTALFLRFYLSYRKQVKRGNLYGKVRSFG